MPIAEGLAARAPHAFSHVLVWWVCFLCVQDLSKLLFNRHGGNPRETKQNILDFNGFAFPDAKAEVSALSLVR